MPHDHHDDDHLDPSLLSRAIALDLPSDGGPPTVPRREPTHEHAGPRMRKPGVLRRVPTRRELEIRAQIREFDVAKCEAGCGRVVAYDLLTKLAGKRLCPACFEAARIAMKHEANRLASLARRASDYMMVIGRMNAPEECP